MKNGTVFYGSKKVIPSQKPEEKVDLLTNRRLKLSVWANMLSDYHILSLEKCDGQKAGSKRKKYFNDSPQNPWKMESLYYVREKKKRNYISLTGQGLYLWEPLWAFPIYIQILLFRGALAMQWNIAACHQNILCDIPLSSLLCLISPHCTQL